LPTTLGLIEDSMVLNSPDLPEGISVHLSVTGSEGNILSGTLSGELPSAVYRITGDINVVSGDELILLAGTEFLFDGQYNFNIAGDIKAQGTELDSIIFDNYGNENWRGFTLAHVTQETVFNYVRISGAVKEDGGGMKLFESNPILTNVIITDNATSDGDGGGMYLENSDPTLINVIISDNLAFWGAGGGVYLTNSSPTMMYGAISRNASGGKGGGLSLSASNPTLTHVTISDNIAGDEDCGGAMTLSGSNPILTHVTITGNTAICAPAMRVSASDPILTNVTISWNTSLSDGMAAMQFFNSNPILTNTIIWGNSSLYYGSSFSSWSSTIIITYSNIAGGWEGEGNIDFDPLFSDPANDDFTLLEDSPCIDAGTADPDGDGYPEITDYFGSAPDMGAFEFEGSSLSGDLNGDGLLNILDVVILVNIVLGYGDPLPSGDLNGDGVLNVLDVVVLVNIILGG